MKIVIATPLYPPEVGGPAQYALNLEKAFTALGHKVVVVRYGALKKFPTGIRHMLYTWRLLFNLSGAGAVIALDTYSVALPAALASMLTRTPLVVRVGGDFLWERYVERTGDLMPIPDFYGRRRASEARERSPRAFEPRSSKTVPVYRKAELWNRKERIIFRQTKWIFSRARAAFNTQWLCDIWQTPYDLDLSRAHVVDNEMRPYEGGEAPARKNFLFYSRRIALKNNEAFRRAFERAKSRHPDIELEEGIVAHDELMKRMRSCYALVVPSISDVAPNFVLDGLRFGKPFLLTKYSGYAERFGEYGIVVDPLSEEDMIRGVGELADKATYERLSQNIKNFRERHSYEDIAREFLALVQ